MHFVSRVTTSVEKDADSITRLEQARAQILACYMRNKPDPEFDRVMAAYYDELEEQADNIHSSQRLPQGEDDDNKKVEEEPVDSSNVHP